MVLGRDCWNAPAGRVRDVHEGVVEARVDVRDGKDLLALADGGAKLHDLLDLGRSDDGTLLALGGLLLGIGLHGETGRGLRHT